MRNQYPGTCYRCGKLVEAGKGHFERNPQFRGWRVQHAECAIAYRGTDVGKDGATEQLQKLQMKRLKERAKGTGKRAQNARSALRKMENVA